MESPGQLSVKFAHESAVHQRRVSLMLETQKDIQTQTGLEIDLGYLLERDKRKEVAFEKFGYDFIKGGLRSLKTKYQIRRLDDNLYSSVTLNSMYQTVLIHFGTVQTDEGPDIFITKSEEITRYKTVDNKFIWVSGIWTRTGSFELDGEDRGAMEFSIFEIEE